MARNDANSRISDHPSNTWIDRIEHSQRYGLASIIVVAEGGGRGYLAQLAEEIKPELESLYRLHSWASQRGRITNRDGSQNRALMSAKQSRHF